MAEKAARSIVARLHSASAEAAEERIDIQLVLSLVIDQHLLERVELELSTNSVVCHLQASLY